MRTFRGSTLVAAALLLIGSCAAPARSVPPELDPANPDAEDDARPPQLSPLVPPGPEHATEPASQDGMAGMEMGPAGHSMGSMTINGPKDGGTHAIGDAHAGHAGHDMGAMKMNATDAGAADRTARNSGHSDHEMEMAAADKEAGGEEHFKGLVVQVVGKSITLKLETGVTAEFITDAKTGIERGDAAAGLKDVVPGERVVVYASRRGKKYQARVLKLATSEVFSCPMHPEVRSTSPGSCPKCGMKLQPTTPQKGPSK